MAEVNIDFEGGVATEDTNATQTNTDANPATQEDTTALSGETTEDVTGKDGNETNGNQEGTTQETQNDDNSSTGELGVGDTVEYDGATYTVAENGDLVDAEGNVFKKASEVSGWLQENEVADAEEGDFGLEAIQNAIGLDILDENGEVVSFTNDAEGVKSYVKAVIDSKSNEISQGAINKLFSDNPMLKDFIDYVTITGTPRGFGDIPDRSGIQLDKDNEAQLISVIKMAAKEFGNTSLNDNYIKYLKSAGALYSEAETQLNNLVERDKAYREEIQKRADAARQQEEADIANYWQSVSEAISKRVINGYKLPETFVKEVDGQRITLTPNDFYDYLSKPAEEDENGNLLTGYQRDLDSLTDEEALNRELLDAWLMFTGGSYKDLVDMAIKENEVKKLIIKSKQQRATKSVKVVKQKPSKVNPDDILF
jgi:hypothetical protein